MRRIAELMGSRDGTPVLLIADEPTTALDVRVQAQIIALFARRRAEHGCSIVLITHDLGVAVHIADRIAVMYHGEVCELGSAAEVLEHPQHDYTRALLATRLDVNKVVVRSRPDAATLAANHRPHDRPVLAVRDIVKTFRRQGGRRGELFVAVDGVSLSVAPGGSTALVGESGCGKSTLLRVATGLTKPDSGTVEITGKAKPQLVFQDAGSSLTPWLSMRPAGRTSANPGAVAPGQCDGSGGASRAGRSGPADGTGPAECAVRRPASACRDRAGLASSPDVLVSDEPVSALDASLAARVLDLLEDLRGSMGVAILMVTHDLAVARRIADDLAVMYQGAVVERGTVDEVFAHPQHPYTQDLLAASPTIYRTGVVTEATFVEPPATEE